MTATAPRPQARMPAQLNFLPLLIESFPKPLETLSNSELRDLCYLPEGRSNLSKEEIHTWLEANREARKRSGKAYIDAFCKKGTGQTWFSREWTPTGVKEIELATVLEEVLHLAEDLYHPLAKHGIDTPEDMGILMHNRRGKSEGIMAKKEPYGNLIHIQFICVTGPTNHDPTDNSIEFEPGAKSHRISLAYSDKLPKPEDLEADICTYPLVTQALNDYRDKHGKKKIYMSEGLMGKLAKTGITLHTPWNTLTPKQQNALKAHYVAQR